MQKSDYNSNIPGAKTSKTRNIMLSQLNRLRKLQNYRTLLSTPSIKAAAAIEWATCLQKWGSAGRPSLFDLSFPHEALPLNPAMGLEERCELSRIQMVRVNTATRFMVHFELKIIPLVWWLAIGSVNVHHCILVRQCQVRHCHAGPEFSVAPVLSHRSYSQIFTLAQNQWTYVALLNFFCLLHMKFSLLVNIRNLISVQSPRRTRPSSVLLSPSLNHSYLPL